MTKPRISETVWKEFAPKGQFKLRDTKWGMQYRTEDGETLARATVQAWVNWGWIKRKGWEQGYAGNTSTYTVTGKGRQILCAN